MSDPDLHRDAARMRAAVSDWLLRFGEPPLCLRLEGFPAEIARSIAAQWLCAIEVADTGCDAYPVSLRKEPRLRFTPRSSEGPRRQIRLRARTEGTTTHLRMAGAQMSFVAGRHGAEIEVHPEFLASPGLMELAVGGPLGHALALTGASFLHGAACVVRDLPILFLGPTGSGKSTIAAATLAGGGTLVSDDSLILYPTQAQGLGVRSLRRDLVLRDGSLGVLPDNLKDDLQQVGPTIDPRWALDRARVPSLFRTTLEPAAVCVLRIDRRLESFRLVALSQAMALTCLLDANASPHLLHPAFPDEQQRLLSLEWFDVQAPGVELRLGPAILDSPAEILGEVLARLRASSAEAS